MATRSAPTLRSRPHDFGSFFFTGLTGSATWLIIAILAVILLNILYQGGQHCTWRFITGGTEKDLFSVGKSGVMPMIFGTAASLGSGLGKGMLLTICGAAAPASVGR